MRFISTLVANIIAILLGSWLLPGIEVSGDNWSVVLIAFVLALLNAFVRPILIILTIPATILTLGLFLLVVNALIILLADYLMDSFHVSGFWAALFFALLLSFVTAIIGGMDRKSQARGRR